MTAEHKTLLSLIDSRNPALAILYTDIFKAFDDSFSDDPDSDSAILTVAISRVAAADPSARATLIRQLEKFQGAGCLRAYQVSAFCNRILAAV